jgi:hypothetical protein
MVTLLWIVIGSIVVGSAIALLGCKRSKATLSEIADSLERQARSDPAESDISGDFP